MTCTHGPQRCWPALAALIAMSNAIGAQVPATPPAAQNPSPMVERSRAHLRIEPTELPSTRRTFDGPLGKPVEVFVPAAAERAAALHLVVFFHGAAFIPSWRCQSSAMTTRLQS